MPEGGVHDQESRLTGLDSHAMALAGVATTQVRPIGVNRGAWENKDDIAGYRVGDDDGPDPEENAPERNDWEDAPLEEKTLLFVSCSTVRIRRGTDGLHPDFHA